MAKRRAKPLTKAKSTSKPRSKSKSKSKPKPKPEPRPKPSRALTGKGVRREAPAWLVVEGPLDKLVDAMARALGLPLEPEWRPAVKTNLDVTLRLAALFADFPLPDDAEPAPVFVA